MAVDAFIYFQEPGSGMPLPEGETQDEFYKTKKAFEIKEFSFDVENQTTIGSATGGAGAGKTKFNPFTIKKATDKASPIFFQNCVAGAHYGKVVVEIRKSGADPKGSGKPFLIYTFGTVFTTKISWSGPGDEAPEEGIEFVYGTLKIEYFPQTKEGGIGQLPKAEAGWSQITNRAHPP